MLRMAALWDGAERGLGATRGWNSSHLAQELAQTVPETPALSCTMSKQELFAEYGMVPYWKRPQENKHQHVGSACPFSQALAAGVPAIPVYLAASQADAWPCERSSSALDFSGLLSSLE